MSMSVAQLEATIQRLEMQLDSLKEDYRTLQDYSSKASVETQDMIKKVRSFCTSILERDITTGEVTSASIMNMSLGEMLNAAESSYRKELHRNQLIYSQFAKKLEEKIQIISGLETQNSQLQIKLSRCSDYTSLPDPMEEAENQSAAVTFNHLNGGAQPAAVNNADKLPDDISVDSFTKAVIKETSADQVSTAKKTKTMVLNDLNEVEQMMSDTKWDIFEAMGKEGISEFSELEKYVLDKYADDKKPTTTTIRKSINDLKNANLIKTMKIKTGYRWFFVHEFKPNGELIFIQKFRTQPVMSEIARLTKDHDNPIHGYSIKDSADILKNIHKYESVSTDRKANYRKISNHRSSIPDIICVKDGVTYFYEVECGNHTQKDFNDKCNKLKCLSADIYFIVPTSEILKKLSIQIEEWIKDSGGRDALAKANITVYLTTINYLATMEWHTVFKMDQDEPILLNSTTPLEKTEANKEE